MWAFTTLRDHAARSPGGVVRLVTIVQRQPSWVGRAAAGAALLVFTGVVLLLVVPAALAATVVFGVLALGAGAARSIRSALRLDASGRRNVRVVARR
ncbi:MAG TPA: hypothetical protein VFF69_07510 [Phycisphaerales bacterium]|nr:hypothetical protein [Phycisphaerales bacterium]